MIVREQFVVNTPDLVEPLLITKNRARAIEAVDRYCLLHEAGDVTHEVTIFFDGAYSTQAKFTEVIDSWCK